MTEEFTNEALAYLLGELDDLQEARFEMRLAADRAATESFKSLAEALAGHAMADSPECPLSFRKREGMAAAVVAAVGGGRRGNSPVWRRLLWPAAAAVLLTLNVAQWSLQSRHEARLDSPAGLAGHFAGALSSIHGWKDRILADPRSPRLLTVDLVDGDHDSHAARKGFVYAEPALLQKPGIVAVAPTTATTRRVTASITTRSTVTLSFAPSAAAVDHHGTPYAWSAFDQGRHQGFLDLHNLPSVPQDHSLQLWVRAPGLNAFERVGEIPAQFYGRSGSITYKLPLATVIPSQILITMEPRSSIPSMPAGPVVLHGP